MPDNVTLRDSQGNVYSVPQEQVAGALAQGLVPESAEQGAERISAEVRREEHGGLAGGAAAAATGALSGLTLGLSDVGIAGLGADRVLRNIQAEHPVASVSGTVAGALAPLILSGGAAAGGQAAGLGSRILAGSPAALASRAGTATAGALAGEGAGLLARAAGATVGAGVEGALGGAGQYLSQVAIEDQPLTAEGFVGGLGKGALFAAPVGGAFTLAERTLVRARSLFPRAEVTPAAARETERAAVSELTQAVSDGDQLAQLARQQLALNDAQAGAAAAGERITRRAFGGADPATLADQVSAATGNQQIADALEQYNGARSRLEKWLSTEDDWAEARDVLLDNIGAAEQDVYYKFGLHPSRTTPIEESVPIATAAGPAPPSPETTRVVRIAKGTDPEAAVASEATGVGRPSAARAEVPAAELPSEPTKVLRGVAEGTPVGSRPGARAAEAPPSSSAAAPAGEVPAYAAIKAHEDTVDDYLEQTLPARAIAERGYYEPPGGGVDAVRVANAKKAIAEGQRDPIKLNVTPSGAITVTDGRHRLAAAIESDAPIKVKWSTGLEPAASDVLRSAAPSAIEAADDLDALLRGTQEQLGAGRGFGAIGAPARAEYIAGKQARATAAAEHFRSQALAARAERAGLGDPNAPWNEGFGVRPGGYETSALAAAERAAQAETVAERAGIGGRGPRYRAKPATAAAEQLRAKATLGQAFGDIEFAPQVERTSVGKAPRRRSGDMTDTIGRAAKAIGDVEEAVANLAEAVGASAPATAVRRAAEYRAIIREHAEASAAGAARAADDLTRGVERTLVDPDLRARVREAGAAERTVVEPRPAERARAQHRDELAAERTVVEPRPAESARARLRDEIAAERTVVEPGLAERARAQIPAKQPAPGATPAQTTAPAGRLGGLASAAANVGTALEVLNALGVNAPSLASIPVIGPALSLFLKARAVLSIIGRKGGAIPRSTESLIAKKAAETRDRIATATLQLLEGGAKVGRIAGPTTAAILATKLFPGDKNEESKDPVELYHARMDEIAMAQQPGAIGAALAERYPVSDPRLLAAVTAQVARGIAFVASKAPKQTILPGMLPDEGKWQPSRAALDEWARYIRAVDDPASVLEDLARGKVTIEGAETLSAVYPLLFAEAQRRLLEAAPTLQRTLPYSTRVALSIVYRVPVDGTMTPQHLQFLAGPGVVNAPSLPPAPEHPATPALTGPITLGQRSLTALDRRAGT